MKALRPILAALLALALTLTGQSMAVAHGASDATGQMVLCVGAGTVTVYTDAQGQPTEAPYVCPECLAASLSAVTPHPLAVPVFGVQTLPRIATFVAAAALVHDPVYLSRAPPALV